MKAMILAAGRGERMMPLTASTPKPLLQVAGKSLIERHLTHLAEAGFREVIINVSWLADQIVAQLGKGEKYNLEIEYSREVDALETGGALLQAKSLLGVEPFLLLNADVFSACPLQKLANIVLDPARLAHLVLVPNPGHNVRGDYTLSGTGLLQSRNSGARPTYTFSGLSVIHPAIFHLFPQDKAKFPLRDVFSRGMASSVITAEVWSGTWFDIGTPERLRALEAHILDSEPE